MILKKRKLITIISLIIVLLITTTFFIVNFYIKSIVENKIEAALNRNKQQFYTVRFNKLKLNWLTRTVIIKNVEILPDSTLFTKMKTDSSFQMAFKIKLKSLCIRQIEIRKIIENKQLNIAEFVLQHPVITYFINENSILKKKPVKKEKHKSFSLDSLYFKGLFGISVHKIKIQNAHLRIIAIKDTLKTEVFDIKKFSVRLSDINIHPVEKQSNYFKFTIGDYSFTGSKQYIPLKGGKYKLWFESIEINKQKSYLVVNKLRLKPISNIYKLAAKSHFSKEFYDIKVDSLLLKKINFRDILEKRQFYVKSIIISNATIKIVKDKRGLENTTKRPLFPNQLLTKMKFAINIDTISIKNAFLFYAERLKNSKKLMTVPLSKINLLATHITSVKDSIIAGAHLLIHLNAKLMKKVPLTLYVDMPLNSASNSFTFSGKIGQGSFPTFNMATKPVGILLMGGRLDNVRFWAKANPSVAYGSMEMKYRDLNVNILKNNSNKQQNVLNWIVNGVIRKNNPSKRYLRKATMFYKRIPYKGLSGFLWKTVFSGIKATVIPSMEKTNFNNKNALLGITKEKRKVINKKKKKH